MRTIDQIVCQISATLLSCNKIETVSLTMDEKPAVSFRFTTKREAEQFVKELTTLGIFRTESTLIQQQFYCQKNVANCPRNQYGVTLTESDLHLLDIILMIQDISNRYSGSDTQKARISTSEANHPLHQIFELCQKYCQQENVLITQRFALLKALMTLPWQFMTEPEYAYSFNDTVRHLLTSGHTDYLSCLGLSENEAIRRFQRDESCGIDFSIQTLKEVLQYLTSMQDSPNDPHVDFIRDAYVMFKLLVLYRGDCTASLIEQQSKGDSNLTTMCRFDQNIFGFDNKVSKNPSCRKHNLSDLREMFSRQIVRWLYYSKTIQPTGHELAIEQYRTILAQRQLEERAQSNVSNTGTNVDGSQQSSERSEMNRLRMELETLATQNARLVQENREVAETLHVERVESNRLLQQRDEELRRRDEEIAAFRERLGMASRWIRLNQEHAKALRNAAFALELHEHALQEGVDTKATQSLVAESLQVLGMFFRKPAPDDGHDEFEQEHHSSVLRSDLPQ